MILAVLKYQLDFLALLESRPVFLAHFNSAKIMPREFSTDKISTKLFSTAKMLTRDFCNVLKPRACNSRVEFSALLKSRGLILPQFKSAEKSIRDFSTAE